jgi:glycogen phosphorylase
MTTKQKIPPPTSAGPDGVAKLREQYGCGPIDFTGTDNALYERHLLFDNVVKPTAVSPRKISIFSHCRNRIRAGIERRQAG